MHKYSITNFILGDCENEENIQKYLNEYNSEYIQILDHQVDLTNYYTPIQSYFMGISSILTHNNGYEVKTINLSPLLVKSNQNLINNDLFEKNAVIVDNIHSSIIGNTNINNSKILLKYLFVIQNYRQIYERKYEDIFGAFSSIGGIIQFFYYIFYLINYFFNDFILILNTQNLFLNDLKSKRFTRLMPFGNYPMRLDSKVGNNILLKNYESNNHIPDLKFFKMLSKDKNDGDMSSIQLSEPNIDKDSKYLFNIIKEENLIEQSASRRSQQLNYNNIIKFKIINDIKNKGGYRNSMFNPKNNISFSPFQKTMDNKSNNIINIMSSNNEESDGERKKNDVKIFKFNDKNDLKQITFIGNKDKNNINNSNSFAEKVKMGNYLKSKKKVCILVINFCLKKSK